MEMEMVFISLGIFMMEMVFRSLGIFMMEILFSEASGSSWNGNGNETKLLETDAILLRTFSGCLHCVNTPSY